MPTAPARIVFAEKIPAALATPEPLFDRPTYATSAKIIASRGRVVNTGAVYLGNRQVFDATLNMNVDNDTSTGLTTAATSTDRTGNKVVGPQVEEAVVAGTITSGTRQVETATAAGTISSGTKQVETATVVGTITTAGQVLVTVTGALVGDTKKEVKVDVAVDDNAAAVAGKIRTALGLVPGITGNYTVGGSSATVVLTAKVEAANDATLNIAVANGTAAGLTAAPTSADTTAGVTPGTAKAVVTSAGMTGSPLTVSFAVAKGDTAADWAAKARAALAANATIAAKFTVSGATTAIILTAKDAVANDATLNIALDNNTSTGVTTAATSADTTAGVTSGNAKVIVTAAGLTGSPLTVTAAVLKDDTAAVVAGKLRNALNATTAVTDLFTVGGTGTSITLTRKDVLVNDTMKYPMAAGAVVELEAGEDEVLNLADIVIDAVTLGDGVQIMYTQSARY